MSVSLIGQIEQSEGGVFELIGHPRLVGEEVLLLGPLTDVEAARVGPLL